jgi:hypothetical protein
VIYIIRPYFHSSALSLMLLSIISTPPMMPFTDVSIRRALWMEKNYFHALKSLWYIVLIQLYVKYLLVWFVEPFTWVDTSLRRWLIYDDGDRTKLVMLVWSAGYWPYPRRRPWICFGMEVVLFVRRTIALTILKRLVTSLVTMACCGSVQSRERWSG